MITTRASGDRNRARRRLGNGRRPSAVSWPMKERQETAPAAAPRSARRWTRPLRRTGLVVVGLVATYVAVTLHPQPLFAHTTQRANVVLHARAAFPAEVEPLLTEVVRRISASPLYDPRRIHDVFLCDTPALFTFFVPIHHRVGGVSRWFLGGDIFIRPFDIVRGTVTGPSGVVKGGERTLAYFIAHELTHSMTAAHVGRWRYRDLAAFQVEGYADYVALHRPVDFDAGRAAIRRDDPEMDPSRSGLYKRYELLVAHLLEHRGLSVEDLLARRLDRKTVEGDLLDARAAPL